MTNPTLNLLVQYLLIASLKDAQRILITLAIVRRIDPARPIPLLDALPVDDALVSAGVLVGDFGMATLLVDAIAAGDPLAPLALRNTVKRGLSIGGLPKPTRSEVDRVSNAIESAIADAQQRHAPLRPENVLYAPMRRVAWEMLLTKTREQLDVAAAQDGIAAMREAVKEAYLRECLCAALPALNKSMVIVPADRPDLQHNYGLATLEEIYKAVEARVALLDLHDLVIAESRLATEVDALGPNPGQILLRQAWSQTLGALYGFQN